MHTYWARGRTIQRFLTNMDDQVWKDLSDELQKICLKRKKVPPCENVTVSRKSASTDTAIPFETSGNLKMSCIIDGRLCGDKEKRELFSCSVGTNTMSGEAGRYV